MNAQIRAVVLFSLVSPIAAQSFAPGTSPVMEAIDPRSADSGQFAEGTRAINQNRWADAVTIFTQVAAARGDRC